MKRNAHGRVAASNPRFSADPHERHADC
jgi:hypothetical protein